MEGGGGLSPIAPLSVPTPLKRQLFLAGISLCVRAGIDFLKSFTLFVKQYMYLPHEDFFCCVCRYKRQRRRHLDGKEIKAEQSYSPVTGKHLKWTRKQQKQPKINVFITTIHVSFR